MVRMLVLRPEPDGTRTAEQLRALGVEPVLTPLFERQRLDTSLPDARGFAAMAVTSAHALEVLAERGDLARYIGLKTFTVGERTAATARQLGLTEVSSAGGTLADLAEKLAHQGLSGPVFYPAARHLSGDLAKSLAPYGVMVVTARVYDMVAVTALPQAVLEGIEQGSIGAALLYSRRAAETFAELLLPHISLAARRRLSLLCLSENVAEPLVAHRFVRISLADYPSQEAMMALALSFARAQNTP